jgi:Leucine-rich repeat (LRR) protein
MWLPRELAAQVGSYLDPHDLTVCAMQLCSSGAEFVGPGFKDTTTTILLHELVACYPLPAGVRSVRANRVAEFCIKRIKSFVAWRGNVQTIVLVAPLRGEHATNASVYSWVHRYLQQGSSFQLSRDPGITIEWHVRAESIEQVEFLLKVDVPKDSARVGDASAGGALRQYLHTLDLSETEVTDLRALASCKSLHTLALSNTRVRNVSALASCKSLHTLDLSNTRVRNVSALASCKSLHTLHLRGTQVSDVSALASCESLHSLHLRETQVSDVSALALFQSLHTLDLAHTQVSDVSALALCLSLHLLLLDYTQVHDVSALASCPALGKLGVCNTQVSDVSALASCQTLQLLGLFETQVRDVSALASCPSLGMLFVTDSHMIGYADVLRAMEGRR